MFTSNGFSNWKHATDKVKGFYRHANTMMFNSKEKAQAFNTIPKNATYTSHDVQNDLIDFMSTIVTEQIVKDVGESCLQLKWMEPRTQRAVKMSQLFFNM